jgi:hypothetical protein
MQDAKCTHYIIVGDNDTIYSLHAGTKTSSYAYTSAHHQHAYTSNQISLHKIGNALATDHSQTNVPGYLPRTVYHSHADRKAAYHI